MNDANNNNEILSLTTPKAAKYMYLSYKNSFTVSLDGTQLTLSDSNQNNKVVSQLIVIIIIKKVMVIMIVMAIMMVMTMSPVLWIIFTDSTILTA